ncbi:MAG: ATP-dependent DNA helicase RecG [Dehalococcoidia bacterium]|nr:ATP-dependent DNA helicase RecG [Dehalococcoidia bacterium]
MIVLHLTCDRLRKILEQEQANGYRDRAVMGGLDRFLSNFAASNRDLVLPEAQYSTLDARQRGEWVASVLRHLDAGIGPVPDKTPASRKEPEASIFIPESSGRFLEAPVTTVKGIRTALAGKFEKLGIRTVRDLLYFFPNRHADYTRIRRISELYEDEEQTIVATVWQATEKITARRKRLTEAVLGDDTGNVRAVWFNQPYLARKLTPGTRIVVSGKVSVYGHIASFQSPQWEMFEGDDLTHTGRLVPVYPLTAGLAGRTVRRLVKENLDRWLPEAPDFLPAEVRKNAGLLPLSEAIRQAHYPDSLELKERARRRLAFDELLSIQLNVLARKRDRQEETGFALDADLGRLRGFLQSLPFDMTSAQKRALNEVGEDLGKSKPMSRLLQGDVGSGKTVVAAAAMLLAAVNGCQAVIMAPTEILAEQHFDTLCGLFRRAGGAPGMGKPIASFESGLPCPVGAGLLTGSLKDKARQEVVEGIASGRLNILAGTHALIQEGVDFHRLGLCVVDEQHRFGVMQRTRLRRKGESPHLLVMSATPIPRTLALTLYGDLDISVINEMPPGRTPIKTRFLKPEQRQGAYNFLRSQVSSGRQAFIICPLIEESDSIDTKAAVTEYDRLSKSVFPDLRLGLLHGRMSAADKEEVMRAFKKHELQVLVSTPVVEVGVDVPNATVMLIEGADRFGLAQLHQFRGRVGRGEHKSYCLLLAETASVEAGKRLELLAATSDGFLLAEKDLELRGPGEFFGTRQSGLPDLKMAKLTDTALLEIVRREAVRLLKIDPYLTRPEHAALGREAARRWDSGGELN